MKLERIPTPAFPTGFTRITGTLRKPGRYIYVLTDKENNVILRVDYDDPEPAREYWRVEL